MNVTPVLSKKQQKLSLSSKKTKSKETIRNVLATPFTKYWPLISTEHFSLLENVLKQCLPKLYTKIKIPWQELKKIPKLERSQFRKEYMKKEGAIVGDRDGIILGINDLTKALENQTVKYILISNDVRPRIMVEHIIDQSVLLQVPVLVVPDLRNIIKETCGISSCVLGFTGVEKYSDIHKTINEICIYYPLPETHINYGRGNTTTDSIIFTNDDILNINDSFTQCDVVQENIENKNVYLLRNNTEHRVFVPKKDLTTGHNNPFMEVNSSSDFLSFFPGFKNPNKNTQIYNSLKVKRVKGNVNRIQKKVALIKQKNKF